jgi:hypothetical protein
MSRKFPVSVCPEMGAYLYMGKFSRSSHFEKRERSRNQCARNCSCWKYLCSPCLENFPWAITLPIPHDRRARAVFCQLLLAKCVVNKQSVANILFTDAARLRRDGFANFHNALVWMDDSSYTTVASGHQHRFSISVWVGILVISS